MCDTVFFCRNSGSIKWSNAFLYAVQVNYSKLELVVSILTILYETVSWCISCGSCDVSGGVVPNVYEVHKLCYCPQCALMWVFCRWEDLLLSFLRCLLASPFMMFLASVLVFNAWFNFTAELTRFADREFYQVGTGLPRAQGFSVLFYRPGGLLSGIQNIIGCGTFQYMIFFSRTFSWSSDL